MHRRARHDIDGGYRFYHFVACTELSPFLSRQRPSPPVKFLTRDFTLHANLFSVFSITNIIVTLPLIFHTVNIINLSASRPRLLNRSAKPIRENVFYNYARYTTEYVDTKDDHYS